MALEGCEPLVLDAAELAFAEQVKSLGMLMEAALLFEKQFDAVAKSVCYQLIWAYMPFPFVDSVN